jgi:hypothetical protein
MIYFNDNKFKGVKVLVVSIWSVYNPNCGNFSANRNLPTRLVMI